MTAQRPRVSKEERLLNLLAALRGTERGLSKSDVRRLVHGYGGQADDAFERMFERDKESLRGLGVPLLTTVSPVHQTDVVYSVPEDEEHTSELSLTAAESAVLAAAADIWREASLRDPARRGLTKLRGLADAPGAVPGDLPGAPSLGLAQPGPAFEPLLQALESGHAVRFDYRAASTGELSRRLVHPWRLAVRGRSWYLVGHDEDRRDVRVFHLGRIQGRVREQPGHVRVPAPDDLDVDAILTDGGDRPVTVRLALAPGRGGLLRRRGTPDQASTGAPGDWSVVTVTAAARDEIVRAVGAVGDGAAVLEPTQVRDAVRRSMVHLAQVRTAQVLPAPEPPKEKRAPRKEAAEDRLARLLSLVLLLRERGDATVAELARHFDVHEEQIVADVDLLWVTGAPGHAHDDLIDFSADAYDSGVISLANDQGIARPLSLSTAETVLLLTALGPLHAVAREAGLETDILESLGEKLVAAGGSGAAVARRVDVEVPENDPDISEQVREALDRGRRLRLTYVSAADRRTEREVDPRSLVHDAGTWLLSAWCLVARAPRTFRVDRILAATVLDVPVAEHAWPERTDEVGSSGEEAVLELASTGRPFAESVPSVAAADLDDGAVRLWLRVADPAWFVGSVLGLGESVLAVGPAPWAERVREAARAALANYQD